MQVPLVRKLATLPLTVQTVGVVEANVSAPFDDVVALSVIEVPAVCVPMAGNVSAGCAKFTVTV